MIWFALSRIIGDTESSYWSLFKALLLRSPRRGTTVEVAVVRCSQTVLYISSSSTHHLTTLTTLLFRPTLTFSSFLILYLYNFIILVLMRRELDTGLEGLGRVRSGLGG